MAFQLAGVDHVRRGLVLRTERPPHPLLVPPDLVHPIVVTTGVGVRHLVELGMKQQTAHGILSAGRRAVKTYASRIIPGILGGDSLVPDNAIGETGVTEILPCNIMKGL